MASRPSPELQPSFDFEPDRILGAVCFDETERHDGAPSGVSTQDLIVGKDGKIRNENEDVFELNAVTGVYKIVEKAAPAPVRNETARLMEIHKDWPEDRAREIAKINLSPKKPTKRGDTYATEDYHYH